MGKQAARRRRREAKPCGAGAGAAFGRSPCGSFLLDGSEFSGVESTVRWRRFQRGDLSAPLLDLVQTMAAARFARHALGVIAEGRLEQGLWAPKRVAVAY